MNRMVRTRKVRAQPPKLQSTATAARCPGAFITLREREAGGNGAPKSADVLAAEEKIAHLEALTADLERRLKQALADQENSRKRSQRDAETAVKFAASGFAAGLLPTLDHLQLALNAVPGDEAAREPMKRLLEGVRATERALLSTMKKHGVKRIASAGEPFDPNLHEAVAVIERDDLPPVPWQTSFSPATFTMTVCCAPRWSRLPKAARKTLLRIVPPPGKREASGFFGSFKE